MAIVIIGAGLAGARAAETLRAEGYTGELVLVGAEREHPYERPPLSKGYLQGSAELSSVYVHEPGWYGEQGVELRLGVAATAIDRAARRVLLADGSALPYERLLLATGATPRRLQVPGADLAGVHYLRTIADSQALREAFARGGEVVIAGAGWIGLETAAAARQAGCEVTVVEPDPAPLYRVLGPEVGGIFARLHERHGVRFRFGAAVTELRGAEPAEPGGEDAGRGLAPGRVREVALSTGEVLRADTVVAGIGVTPNVELAREAGLEVDDGVVTDASLRTADPAIWAAGDVARSFNPLLGRHIRVEHWANARNGGPAAARAMLGERVVYDRVPYFYSDQFELGMEFSGDITGHDEIVYRGSVEDLEFIAFWLRHGTVVAAMNVNVWEVVADLQALIRSGRPVEAKRLADPNVPLAEV
ncbi:MAG: FAD-dependent oxidoreductase [Actinomycetes bacterium]|jgi:3-phenylpropionate/trans-cinnamate dioxygenase ferredoxin reductase subunit|nr:MAG: FAD-dependent oxidoreductase [Actinomycetota bacterium]